MKDVPSFVVVKIDDEDPKMEARRNEKDYEGLRRTARLEPSFLATPSPLTFYTTFSHFTTVLSDGKPSISTRLEVITNVFTDVVLPTRTTDEVPPRKRSRDVVKAEANTVASEEAADLNHNRRPQARKLLSLSSKENEFSVPDQFVVTDEEAASANRHKPGLVARSAGNEGSSADKAKDHPVGLIQSAEARAVRNGATTVYATEVYGTFINGAYAQVVSTAVRVFSDQNQRSSSHLPSRQELTTSLGSPAPTRPTGLISSIANTVIHDSTTTAYTTNIYGTYIRGMYAHVAQTTSTVIKPQASKSVSSITKSQEYKTGLISSLVNTEIHDATTTVWKTHVYGTLINGFYAHVASTASELQTPEPRSSKRHRPTRAGYTRGPRQPQTTHQLKHQAEDEEYDLYHDDDYEQVTARSKSQASRNEDIRQASPPSGVNIRPFRRDRVSFAPPSRVANKPAFTLQLRRPHGRQRLNSRRPLKPEEEEIEAEEAVHSSAATPQLHLGRRRGSARPLAGKAPARAPFTRTRPSAVDKTYAINPSRAKSEEEYSDYEEDDDYAAERNPPFIGVAVDGSRQDEVPSGDRPEEVALFSSGLEPSLGRASSWSLAQSRSPHIAASESISDTDAVTTISMGPITEVYEQPATDIPVLPKPTKGVSAKKWKAEKKPTAALDVSPEDDKYGIGRKFISRKLQQFEETEDEGVRQAADFTRIRGRSRVRATRVQPLHLSTPEPLVDNSGAPQPGFDNAGTVHDEPVEGGVRTGVRRGRVFRRPVHRNRAILDGSSPNEFRGPHGGFIRRRPPHVVQDPVDLNPIQEPSSAFHFGDDQQAYSPGNLLETPLPALSSHLLPSPSLDNFLSSSFVGGGYSFSAPEVVATLTDPLASPPNHEITADAVTLSGLETSALPQGRVRRIKVLRPAPHGEGSLGDGSKKVRRVTVTRTFSPAGAPTRYEDYRPQVDTPFSQDDGGFNHFGPHQNVVPVVPQPQHQQPQDVLRVPAEVTQQAGLGHGIPYDHFSTGVNQQSFPGFSPNVPYQYSPPRAAAVCPSRPVFASRAGTTRPFYAAPTSAEFRPYSRATSPFASCARLQQFTSRGPSSSSTTTAGACVADSKLTPNSLQKDSAD
ncbi:hypothetical protein MTO96_025485 [Rhipicephalus appendiculatus]